LTDEVLELRRRGNQGGVNSHGETLPHSWLQFKSFGGNRGQFIEEKNEEKNEEKK
jgi:hypothetical protein